MVTDDKQMLRLQQGGGDKIMVDIDKLKEKISESGMMLKTISERSGITPPTLARRLKGEGDFTADEIVGLSKALKLKASERNDIFLRD